jgi:hypothetical protein
MEKRYSKSIHRTTNPAVKSNFANTGTRSHSPCESTGEYYAESTAGILFLMRGVLTL